jgi:hypothetical protein
MANRYRWREVDRERPKEDGMYWVRARGYTGAAWYSLSTPAFYHDGSVMDADLWAFIPSMPTGDSNG